MLNFFGFQQKLCKQSYGFFTTQGNEKSICHVMGGELIVFPPSVLLLVPYFVLKKQDTFSSKGSQFYNKCSI